MVRQIADSCKMVWHTDKLNKQLRALHPNAVTLLLILRGAGATSLKSTLEKPLTNKHTEGEGLHTWRARDTRKPTGRKTGVKESCLMKRLQDLHWEEQDYICQGQSYEAPRHWDDTSLIAPSRRSKTELHDHEPDKTPPTILLVEQERVSSHEKGTEETERMTTKMKNKILKTQKPRELTTRRRTLKHQRREPERTKKEQLDQIVDAWVPDTSTRLKPSFQLHTPPGE